MCDDFPVISVVVCAYQARQRIDIALGSLELQDFDEPFEVIVVDSGQDGTSEHVRNRYPGVRVVRSETRLRPAAARNRGVEAARGMYVAFLPDDGRARLDWLRLRVAKHREGFRAVGGAITNGTPSHPIGSAGYYLEYSALIPSDRILAEQAIPHTLSYERELLEELGPYPEDVATGEDTLLNRQIAETGASVGFDARIQFAHENLRRLGPYLRHQFEHGRGLLEGVVRHGAESAIGPIDQPVTRVFWRIFAVYPARRYRGAAGRIARGRPASLPGFVVVTPFVWAGLLAASLGIWRDWRDIRKGA
jgi:glycosyltransferase involved in cell wall biosynthesis